ncbi:L-arabinokinase isoform X1 [Tanacetum coccineum]
MYTVLLHGYCLLGKVDHASKIFDIIIAQGCLYSESYTVLGIDSGLRHNIGGADYGSVIIGSFMGGKMIKSTASDISSQSYSNGNENNLDELEEYGIEPFHDEASLDSTLTATLCTVFSAIRELVDIVKKTLEFGARGVE